MRALVEEAGALALSWLGRELQVRRKEDRSPVTEADLAVERLLLAGLGARWPEDAVLSEEAGAVPGAGCSGATWHVDPIDGTSAFTEGLAYWGPTLARVRDGRALLGAIALPRLQACYLLDGGRVTGPDGPLAPLDVGTGRAVVYVPSAFARVFLLPLPVKIRCLGGTAAHLALVAAGAASAAVVGPGWRMWDAAAGLGMIDALGGRAVRVSDGEPLQPERDEGAPFVAGRPDYAARVRTHIVPGNHPEPGAR